MTQTLIAFEGTRRIAAGAFPAVAAAVKPVVDRAGNDPVLIFNAETSEPVEIDFRGSLADVLARAPSLLPAEGGVPEEPRGPGRPRLGVVAREVTLLPRHWEWLRAQPGGASVALRKLVDAARNASGDRDRHRQAKEAAYRFIHAVGGNLPDFDEVTRALFAGDRKWFAACTARWPADVRDHAVALAFRDLE